MKRLSIGLLLSLFLAGVFPFPQLAAAADRHKLRQQRADRVLTDVLRAESAAGVGDRAGLLRDVLESSPRHAAVRWQSGFLKSDGRWLRFDEVPATMGGNDVLSQYKVFRSQFRDTIEGRLELANWCRKHRLSEQERVHLLEALEMQPDSPRILRRLGLERVGGLWFSASENKRIQRVQAADKLALQKWRPRLEKIRDGLNSPTGKKRRLADKQLQAIDDPESIRAIEHVLCRDSERCRLTAVAAFQRISAYQASEALANLAVESDNLWVRKAAIEALQSKPRQEYVPALLIMLSTPATADMAVSYLNRNRILLRQLLRTEGQYQRKAKILDTEILLPTEVFQSGVLSQLTSARLQRYVEDYSRSQENDQALENKQVARLSEDVFTVLRATNDVKLPNDPHEWWRWWSEEIDTEVTYKPWECRYQRDYQNVVLPSLNFSLRPVTSSCLRAGTPVWTESGLMPVEQIQAGDRVLSKNVETGELTLKPVLKPTERAREPLKRLELGGETIICTSGHPFWISGTGWTMVKQFAPGMRLHTVTGTHEVKSVTEGPEDWTYNLIVDDFHTYFVGRSMILSHDNTLRAPTNAVVPGLSGFRVKAQ